MKQFRTMLVFQFFEMIVIFSLGNVFESTFRDSKGIF